MTSMTEVVIFLSLVRYVTWFDIKDKNSRFVTYLIFPPSFDPMFLHSIPLQKSISPNPSKCLFTPCVIYSVDPNFCSVNKVFSFGNRCQSEDARLDAEAVQFVCRQNVTQRDNLHAPIDRTYFAFLEPVYCFDCCFVSGVQW